MNMKQTATMPHATRRKASHGRMPTRAITMFEGTLVIGDPFRWGVDGVRFSSNATVVVPRNCWCVAQAAWQLQ